MILTYIRVTIRPLGPWRVGAVGQDQAALETLRDNAGRPALPPSSLAGSFRAGIDEAARELLMGQEKTKDGKPDFQASTLWFLGTRLTGGENGQPEIRRRTATAVDRNRRAARNHGSHDVEEVYDTETIQLYLRHEGDPAKALQLLGQWQVTIGGGISTGLGHAKVTAISYRTLDLSHPADLLARVSLRDAGPDALDALLQGGTDHKVTAEESPTLLEATIRIDGLNLPTQNLKDQLRPEDHWFHGTRWKGILRGRVEYIGRSLGLDICGAEDQQWRGCGRCAVCEVFGSGETGVGRWSFHFTPLEPDHPAGRTRNAIDRFTGGVAEKKLFPEKTVTCQAQLVIGQLDGVEEHHAWVLKALLLALRDLQEGYLGIGGRTSTGLGSVQFEKLKLGEEFQRFKMTATSLKDVEGITEADIELERTHRSLKKQKEKEEKETQHA